MFRFKNIFFMNYFRFILIVTAMFYYSEITAQQLVTPNKGNWSKGAAERFKGDVWVEFFVNDTSFDFLSSRVLFHPNARSNWHKHTGKQIIFAIEGEGYYKEKGKPINILKKGDVVIIEPGTVHSHGSLGKKFMQAVMMNDIKNVLTSTTWLQPVEDDELK